MFTFNISNSILESAKNKLENIWSGVVNFGKTLDLNLDIDTKIPQSRSTPESLIKTPEQEPDFNLPERPTTIGPEKPSREVDVLPGPRREYSYLDAYARGDKPNVTLEPQKAPVSRPAVEEAAKEAGVQLYKEPKPEEDDRSLYRKIGEADQSFWKGLGNLAMEIPRAPVRLVTGTGIEIAAWGVSPFVGDGQQIRAEWQPNTRLQKLIYGEQPIKGVTVHFDDSRETADKIAKTLEIDGSYSQGAIDAMLPLIISGSIALDAVPFEGSGKKAQEKAAKIIAGSKDVEEIAGLLKGIFKNEIEELTPLAWTLKNMDNPDDVLRLFGDLSSDGFRRMSVDDLSKNAINSIENNPNNLKERGLAKTREYVGDGEVPSIDVRQTPEGKLWIDDGAHRLEYAKQQGAKEIKINDVTSRYEPNKKIGDFDIPISGAGAKTEAEKLAESGIKVIDDMISVDEKTGRVLVNYKNLDVTDQQKEVIDAVVERYKDELVAPGGEKLTFKEILKRADSDAEEILGVVTREETEKMAAQELKLRQAEVTAAEKLRSANTPETRKAAVEELVNTITESNSIGTDLARRLSARRIKAGDNTISQITKDLMKHTDDIEKLKKELVDIDWNDEKAVESLYNKFIKPTAGELFKEFRYTNMLSNPRTQMRNIFSNLMQTFITRPAVKTAEAAVDAFSSLLTGADRTAFFKEVPIYYRNAINATFESWDVFKKAYTEGTRYSNDDLANAIKKNTKLSSILPEKYAETNTAKFLDSMWNKYKMPIKAMEAADRSIMNIISKAEFAAQKAKGASDDVAQKAADQIAEYSLFRAGLDPNNKLERGKLLAVVDQITSKIDGLRKVPGGSWIIPFLSTPMNFAKQWLEFTPGVGLLNLAGNANKKEVIAKQLLGGIVMSIGAQMAATDNTTWGVPNTEDKRELFFGGGENKKKPYAVKVGEHWIPYIYFGPFALAMALPAAYKYYSEDSPTALTDSQLDMLGKTAMASVDLFTQQTFLESVGNFVDIARNLTDERKAEEIGKQLALFSEQTVPMDGLMRYITTALDPIYRKIDGSGIADSYLEALKRDLPFMYTSEDGFDWLPSTGLEPYRDPSTLEPTKRNWSNYFAPYDIVKDKEKYDEMLNTLREETQSKNIIKENDPNTLREALDAIDQLKNPDLSVEEKGALLSKVQANDAQFKAIYKSLEDAAKNELATNNVWELYRDDQEGLASILYVRLTMAETPEERKEVAQLIMDLQSKKILNKNGYKKLYGIFKEESEQSAIANDPFVQIISE